jgi:apolipoprotein N-acyltransferase
MWNKLLASPRGLAIVAGTSLFLAFEKFGIVPLIIFFPAFFNRLTFFPLTGWQAFRIGFFTSFIIMLGGFYWVVYVLHEFGYLPWIVAGLLYLGFCGFGALNFPLFTTLARLLHRRVSWDRCSPWAVGIWFALGLPSLFTAIEWSVPKLFPWYMGHCLYKQIWLTQLAEITGTTYLTFCLYSLGSVGGLFFLPAEFLGESPRPKKTLWAIPAGLIALALGFSFYRIQISPPATDGKLLSVALIQANIGSLEKVAAEKGIGERVRHVVSSYESLTEKALAENPADLVIWPETAMPFQLESDKSYPREIREFVKKMRTTFIIGGYQQSPKSPVRDYNSAFLLEPSGSNLRMEAHPKNILLAFGEYLPFGDIFPSLYLRFPQVADFDRGTTQEPFVLLDGTRLGITICYEDIVPHFYRKVISNKVHAVVNLTNDSWFGPTSEPYLHGQLTPFRSIESRVPLFRVTNTGISFAVDSLGRMTETTRVFEPQALHVSLRLPKDPPLTFYSQWGDWFIILCMLLLGLSASLLFKIQIRKESEDVSVSV